MKDSTGFSDSGTLNVSRSRGDQDPIKFEGEFTFELIRDGKIVSQVKAKNTVTNEGRNKILGIGFHGDTPVSPWYIGLINGTSANVQTTDTMVSHAGWTENSAYSEATRQSWTTNAAASQQITSTSSATFTMNASGSVMGFFISSVSTKASTIGTLWSGSTFTSVPVVNGDQVKVTYTLTSN